VSFGLRGIPNAGKTTISRLVSEKLISMGFIVERIDSDEVPRSLTKDLSSDWVTRQRQKCINLIYISKLLHRQDVIVLLASVGRLNDMRSMAREQIADYVEVFLTCPLKTRLLRDQLAKYQRYPDTIHYYEEPVKPELMIETDLLEAEACAERVIVFLEERGFIKRWD
jgi:adenylylsulfate kinase